jgi:cytochrome P450
VTTFSDLPVLATTGTDYWQDPHAALRAAREHGPVARSPWGGLVLLDYDDCMRALSDARFTNDYDALLTRNDVLDGPLWDWWQLAMLNNNPPVHTRLRALVSRAFTPRSVARAAEPTRRVTAAILDGALARGRIDLVRELCEPLPIAVMCDLIGVPRSEHGDFDRWISDLGLMFSASMTPETRRTAEGAMADLSGAITDLGAARRRAGDPGDDLLGDLIAAEDGGDRLGPDELIAMIVNLLFGALDTTRGALSLHVTYLVQHPDELGTLRDGGVTPEAVEELLRIEPPIGEIARSAGVDLELHGHPVPQGEIVGLSVLSANRDATRFPDPWRFDATRHRAGSGGSPILTFGRGIHHCIGAALARLELREALATLLERCRTIEIDGDAPGYVPFLSVRCTEEVTLGIAPV